MDYQQLNQGLIQPQPHIHYSFRRFAGAPHFTTLDLNSVYYQIPLHKDSRHYTAFATDYNLFEFTSLPFGLAVGDQVLTQLLDKILEDIKLTYLCHRLDDLCIYPNTFKEHLLHVTEVFTRLHNAGLTINPQKVKFATSELRFLGHIISAQGDRLDPDLVVQIREYPRPRTVKHIARFLGMVNHFLKFIPDCADSAEPLNGLRKKGVKFHWDTEQEKAFIRLKECLMSPSVLAVPDLSKKFVLQTDA